MFNRLLSHVLLSSFLPYCGSKKKADFTRNKYFVFIILRIPPRKWLDTLYTTTPDETQPGSEEDRLGKKQRWNTFALDKRESEFQGSALGACPLATVKSGCLSLTKQGRS